MSRGEADVSVDGRWLCRIGRGAFIKVSKSRYSVPCVNRIDEGVDWVRDLNHLLKWNQGFENKQQLLQEEEEEEGGLN